MREKATLGVHPFSGADALQSYRRRSSAMLMGPGASRTSLVREVRFAVQDLSA